MKKTFREWSQEAEADPVYWTERAILRVTEEIFVAMEKRGMQRSELARRLGTSPAYVTKILRGKANFTLESLARIALALGGEFEFHFLPHDVRTPRFSSAVSELSEPTLRTPAPKQRIQKPRSKIQPRR
ncbi:MAG: helix-turn-helix transcriptional regulator [Thermoanaerobaculia bacterium]|nr:helix-turn-helix transcriptional regulator [Thermoanaerobaculia bacterium]